MARLQKPCRVASAPVQEALAAAEAATTAAVPDGPEDATSCYCTSFASVSRCCQPTTLEASLSAGLPNTTFKATSAQHVMPWRVLVGAWLFCAERGGLCRHSLAWCNPEVDMFAWDCTLAGNIWQPEQQGNANASGDANRRIADQPGAARSRAEARDCANRGAMKPQAGSPSQACIFVG